MILEILLIIFMYINLQVIHEEIKEIHKVLKTIGRKIECLEDYLDIVYIREKYEKRKDV